MALLTCPECNNYPVSDQAEMCLKCGFPVSKMQKAIVSSAATNYAPDPGEGRSAGDSIEIIKGMRFLWCPPGDFVMGTPRQGGNEVAVAVTLSKGFWLGETVVTQEQWKAVMKSSPWSGGTGSFWEMAKAAFTTKMGVNFRSGGTISGHIDVNGKAYVRNHCDIPATFVSHGGATPEADSAQEYCRRLTRATQNDERWPPGWRFTLPTEAQWEYACRAGTSTLYSFGDDDAQLSTFGWYGKNAWWVDERFAHPVARKRPNSWGLYDMHGNVWEWCSDWYRESRRGGTDPEVTETAARKVARGGCWAHSASDARSAFRGAEEPNRRTCYIGFRVAIVFGKPQ